MVEQALDAMHTQGIGGSWKAHALCELLDQFANHHDKLVFGATPTTLSP